MVVDLQNTFYILVKTASDAQILVAKLQTCMSQGLALGYDGLSPVLKTLGNWLESIANFAHERLTNAAMENLNNVIWYLKLISYGLPNFELLRLIVLAQVIRAQKLSESQKF